MFAADITRWLNDNMTTGSRAYVVEHQAEIRDCLEDLGIAAGTELAYFYLNFDATAVSGWYSLNEIDQLQDATDYAQSEYDVLFGQFEALADGSLAPLAESFQGFLRWCKGQEAAP